MIQIYMLPADEGDFLWIRYGNETMFNILIDGGVKGIGYAYAEVLQRIYNRGEKVEAIILTHIDNDHIQGALEGISMLPSELLQTIVKHVYFNTCQGIQREQSLADVKIPYAEDEIRTRIRGKGFGAGEAITFLDLLRSKGLLERLLDYVVAGQNHVLADGAVLRIISPGRKELKALAQKWEAYEKAHQVQGYCVLDGRCNRNLRDLMKERLGKDTSVNNRSSIAFLFEYEGNRLAFLADAEPGVCIRGLRDSGIAQPCPVHAMKLSHHGSRANLSDQLLRYLPTQFYMVSTNGHGKKVPDKVMLAHLLKNQEACGGTVNLLTNYDWWRTAYHNMYFTEQDQIEYLQTGLLRLSELGDTDMKIKDGLEAYGDYK